MSLGYSGAADAITQALLDGFDPSGDPPRSSVDLSAGSFLLMPSEVGETAGLKLLTFAPGNPTKGLPKIQGHYLLFDSATLSPSAIIDGEALTALRTPALSLAAARPFLERFSAGPAGPTQPAVAIFGAGPQGVGHAAALKEELGDLESVTFIVRNPEASGDAAREAGHVVASGSENAQAALANAHIIVCATGAREALFAADQVRKDALVIALGSHFPEAREVPAALVARSTVVVEDRGAALREAGDVIRAISDGALDASALVEMKDLLSGKNREEEFSGPDGAASPKGSEGPVVVKTVGMGWQDLAVAAEVVRRN